MRLVLASVILALGLCAAAPAASAELTIYKARRELLFVDGPLRRTFRIGLGRNPVGIKTREGIAGPLRAATT